MDLNCLENKLCSSFTAHLFDVLGQLSATYIACSKAIENIISACVVAKALGIKVIGLTGKNDSLLNKYADVCIRVPESETYKVQELHLPVYHCLCLMLESNYFKK